MGRGGALPTFLLSATASLASIIAMAAFCGASSELEPNDDRASANSLPNDITMANVFLGTSNASDPDWWVFNGTEPGVIIIGIDDNTPCDSLHLENSTGALMTVPRMRSEFGFVYSIVVEGPVSILARPCATGAEGTYFISSFIAPATGADAGADEVEPNDDFSHATLLAAGGYVSGFGSQARLDVDVFVWNSNSSRYLAVEYQPTFMTYLRAFEGGTELAWSGTLISGLLLLGPVAPNATYHLAVSFVRGDYSFTYREAYNLSEFSEGVGEVEPNDTPPTAMAIGEGDFQGLIHRAFEDVDMFQVRGARGDLIRIRVDCFGGNGSYGGCSPMASMVSGGPAFRRDCCTVPSEWYEVSVLLASDATLVFGIQTVNLVGWYVLHMTVTATTVLTDGIIELGELQSLGLTVVSTWSREPYPDPAPSLAYAASSYFIQSRCYSTLLDAAVESVTAAQGAVLESHPEEFLGIPMVAVTNASLTLGPAPLEGCLLAAFLAPPHNDAEASAAYLVNGSAEPQVLQVVRLIASRGDYSTGAALAIFAISARMNETTARTQWGADNETLEQARELLNASGIPFCGTALVNESCYPPLVVSGEFTWANEAPSTPVNGMVEVQGGLPPYQVVWIFGDGQVAAESPTTHTYGVEGNFTAYVIVTDAIGTPRALSFRIVRREPGPPLFANYAAMPAIGVAGQPVEFRASVNGGVGPFTIVWDFGDDLNGTGQPITHRYAAPGTYTVTLTITDSRGTNVSTSFQLTQLATAGPFGLGDGFYFLFAGVGIAIAAAALWFVLRRRSGKAKP